MQLECAIETFPLPEVLDLCVRTMITGAVEVEGPTGYHRVFVRGGRIYHAESPRDSGFDALWPLFELADARFKFRAGMSSHERTIDERPSSLLQRAQRLGAEWRAIRPMIASLDVVPRLVVPDELDTVMIDEEHWMVLCLADGWRTIREIAGEACIEPIDACRILVRLNRRGLVRLNQERHYTRHPLLARGRQSDAGTPPDEANNGSYFARLLAALPPDPLHKPEMEAAPPPNEAMKQVEAIMRILGTN